MRGTIRPMVPGDLKEVLRIIRLHDTDDARHARRTLEEFLASPDLPARGQVVFESLDEGRVLGTCGYHADRGEGEGIFWLGWFYVNPFFHGRGIGAALFEYVVGEVRRLGGRKLYCDTSSLPKYQRAIRFYHEAGFRQEGRLVDYYRPGEDMIILGKTL